MSYFQSVLGCSVGVSVARISVSSSLSSEDHVHLLRSITCDEIKSAMFSIHGNKAPGPDGFNASFFKKKLECSWGECLLGGCFFL